MNGFAPLVQASATLPDPTKHVHYVLGMILGQDDLDQEFAYASHRDQWLARDLIGYGTVWGLKLDVPEPPGPRGPEVRVSSGVALSPRGQLIRVAPAQCAALNEWLGDRTADVTANRDNVTSRVTLHVVLSYRECLSDPVPIAGEPCRSEQDSVADSRIADDFLLELRFTPPAQTEEDALVAFMDWLEKHITVTRSGPATPANVADFVTALRKAADVGGPLPGPSGPFMVETNPAFAATIPASQLPQYLRAALRVFVTELRPRWRPLWLGSEHACRGDYPFGDALLGNEVLLGTLSVPLVQNLLDPSNPKWQVSSGPDKVLITEDRRPWLLELRMLQEWVVRLSAALSANERRPQTIACGLLAIDPAAARPVYGGLKIASTALPTGKPYHEVTLTWSGYNVPAAGRGAPVLKALAWPDASMNEPVAVVFAGFQAAGAVLRVSKGAAALTDPELKRLQLMVEVTQYE